MSFFRFITVLLFINIINLTDNYLLSRVRNTNEYVPHPSDTLLIPEDLDDVLYNNLVDELPYLKTLFRQKYNQSARNHLPFLKVPPKTIVRDTNYGSDYNNYFDYDRPEVAEQTGKREKYIEPVVTTERRLPFITIWPPRTTLKRKTMLSRGRRKFLRGWPKKATCYWCGLNETALPPNPLCHDAFASDDWKARTMARFLRARCYKTTLPSMYTIFNPWSDYYHQRRESKYHHNKNYPNDPGAFLGVYHPDFMGGCFKRYLDIGNMWTVRGCRTWWPLSYKHGFVDHRYKRLESLLKKEKDVCITSPHASLTPFARGISLFARYHVCVCSQRFCNTAQNNIPQMFVIFILSLVYLFTN